LILFTDKNGFIAATKLGTSKSFVAATKNFAAATKRFVDRTTHFVVVTKYYFVIPILINDFVGITNLFSVYEQEFAPFHARTT